MQFVNATEIHYSDIANLVSSPEELYLVYPSGSYPWSIKQLQELAKIRLNFTICMIENRIVAFANLYHVKVGESAFIGNVIVSKDYQGQSIGKALTQYMMEVCQTQHKAIPHLSVFNFNTRALLMYTQLGFEPYAIEPRKNLTGDSVALIHMQYGKKIESKL